MIRRLIFPPLQTRLFSNAAKSPSVSCPACRSKDIQIREDLFCCKTCPNMQGIDYFRLLSLPRDYSVDLKRAESNFRDMQQRVHPDKVDDTVAANIPEGFSSLLNKAIKVIKSPTERAMHLLYLLDGCTIGEADLTNDPKLLMEMMEINEEVDDCGRDKKCLEQQNVANEQRLTDCDSELKTLFVKREFSRARAVCERMHYLERVKDTILQKLNSV